MRLIVTSSQARDFLLDQLHGWQPEAFQRFSPCRVRL